MSHWRSFLEPDARGGRYLPWKEVARATGLSRTTAWRLQKRDDFPAPYAISPGRVGYREDEVEAWRVSRDHSAARLPASPSPPGAQVAGPARDGGTRAPSHPPDPQPAAAAPEPRPASPPRGLPPVRRTKGARRRSQHAQAIAQQMLFDF